MLPSVPFGWTRLSSCRRDSRKAAESLKSAAAYAEKADQKKFEYAIREQSPRIHFEPVRLTDACPDCLERAYMRLRCCPSFTALPWRNCDVCSVPSAVPCRMQRLNALGEAERSKAAKQAEEADEVDGERSDLCTLSWLDHVKGFATSVTRLLLCRSLHRPSARIVHCSYSEAAASATSIGAVQAFHNER